MEETEARKIASDWHGGQWTALYSFASTGTVKAGVVSEVRGNLPMLDDPRRYRPEDAPALRAELESLAAYLEPLEPCGCSEEYGPCEAHGDVLVIREGASQRTADELAYQFVLDVIDINGEDDTLSATGKLDFAEIQAAFDQSERGSLNIDMSERLSDLMWQVESNCDLWVTRDDGYVITRVTGGPLAE